MILLMYNPDYMIATVTLHLMDRTVTRRLPYLYNNYNCWL